MGCAGAPRCVNALAARRRPKRLAFVKIARRPGAETLGDEPRPVHPRDLCREIGDGRQCTDFRFGRKRGRLQLNEAGGTKLDGRRRKGLAQVRVGDRAAGNLIEIPTGGHCDGNACHTRQTRSSLRKRLTCLTQERVHGDARCQWPNGRDRSCRLIDGFDQIGALDPEGCFMSCHV